MPTWYCMLWACCRGAGHSRVASYGQPRAQRTCSPWAIGYRPVACDTPEAAFAIPRVCSYAVKSFGHLQPCPLALTLCTDPCLGLASSFSISPIPQILVCPSVLLAILVLFPATPVCFSRRRRIEFKSFTNTSAPSRPDTLLGDPPWRIPQRRPLQPTVLGAAENAHPRLHHPTPPVSTASQVQESSPAGLPARLGVSHSALTLSKSGSTTSTNHIDCTHDAEQPTLRRARGGR